jgi:hypothetical protein
MQQQLLHAAVALLGSRDPALDVALALWREDWRAFHELCDENEGRWQRHRDAVHARVAWLQHVTREREREELQWVMRMKRWWTIAIVRSFR